jgi:starch synthase
MLPRAELVAVLDACTAFVCPSIYEPLGIVNLEAMAVGLPVVASATGGIPEVVVDGVTGFLVAPRDDAAMAAAIVTLLKDPDLRQRMGQAGLARARELFSADRMLKETLKVYRRVALRPQVEDDQESEVRR